MSNNVLIVCLDSVRKDFFDDYAPRLQDRSSSSFDQCRAASSWSSPSHASMLTGYLPHRHGIHVHNRDFSGLPAGDSIMGDLNGHYGIGVSANAFASSSFGFDSLFDTFTDVSTGRRFPEGIDPNEYYLDAESVGLARYFGFLKRAVRHDHPIASLANGILASLNVVSRDARVPKLLDDGAAVVSRALLASIDDAPEPWFAFSNFGDAHVPFRPIRSFDRQLYDAPADWSSDEVELWEVMESPDGYDRHLEFRRQLYAAAIDYLDRRIVSLIDRIDRRTDRDTSIVVTADHGENLGFQSDDGLVGHKSSLGEGLLHVPLIVIDPSVDVSNPKGDYTTHLDLRNLVVGLAGGELPDISRDTVVAEVVGMSPGPDPPSKHEFWDRMIRCAYRGTSKYEWDSAGNRRRYELRFDRPCWQRLIEDEAEIPDWGLDRFDEPIDAFKRRVSTLPEEEPRVDPTTHKQLRDLGYR